MKRVILIPIVFLVLQNTGDANKLEALVKEATGAEHAEGFEFEMSDDSVNVTVADGAKVNVPANGPSVMVYNTQDKTWSVEDAASWEAKTVEYALPATAGDNATEATAVV